MAWLAKPQHPEEAAQYSHLKQGQQVLLIGDALSVQVVFHNLTGRNFQARDQEGVRSLVPWQRLKEANAEYRHYLDYMEEDLGTPINPDDLSLALREPEDQKKGD